MTNTVQNVARITVILDGRPLEVPVGTSAAAALAWASPQDGMAGCSRLSVSGEARAPLCGMGICHECRVLIDGCRRLACQTPCREGMRIETGLRPLPQQEARP